MRKILLHFTLSLLVFFILVPSPVFGSEDTVVTITIEKEFYVFVHGGPLEYYPDANDFNADVSSYDSDYEANGYGWTDPEAVEVRIWANWPWDLFVKGTGGTTFDFGGKPVGDILWMDGATSGWHPLTTSNVYVNEGGVPDPPGNPPDEGFLDVDVTFRCLLHWENDGPGTYIYDSVLFTALSQ